MDKEKADFARRLRAALLDADIEASASVLEKRFNQRYEGAPVSEQAIGQWLNGRVMPRQDKLRVLAAIVGVDPEVLQYGSKPRVGEGRLGWDALAAPDKAMVDAFLALSPAQRKLVRDLVAMLAAAR